MQHQQSGSILIEKQAQILINHAHVAEAGQGGVKILTGITLLIQNITLILGIANNDIHIGILLYTYEGA